VFENTIKFKVSEKYLKNTDVFPIPAKLNIPDWYKELIHTVNFKTVKGCMPFLDTLSTGYILKLPADYNLRHNIQTDVDRFTDGYTELSYQETQMNDVNLNHKDIDAHAIMQIGKKCPFANKNKDLKIHKLLNPWIIETPPGYSCLFLPPLNNADDRFSIIAGIVDTDTFPNEINFPMIVNGDKYPVLETVLEKDTPYVQVIPFKREKWKMKIEKTNKKISERFFLYKTKIFQNYKNNFWSKKSWK
jgi:hypothetical protein